MTQGERHTLRDSQFHALYYTRLYKIARLPYLRAGYPCLRQLSLLAATQSGSPVLLKILSE
jgi:hypothetical protein